MNKLEVEAYLMTWARDGKFGDDYNNKDFIYVNMKFKEMLEGMHAKELEI